MGLVEIPEMKHFVDGFQFEEILLHWLLPVLLFAGSLHVSVTDLRAYKFQILIFSTVGVLISALIVGGILFHVSPFLGIPITFMQSLVFGVLISATDPVCVLGILNKGNVSPALKAKITGESLFNDGTTVLLFLAFSKIAFGDTDQSLDYLTLAKGLAIEVLGGIAVGLAMAFVASLLTVLIDAHDVEIMITIALAFGSYAVAENLHVSAPIAVVIAGLYIGNRTIKKFMSEKSREHVNAFWTLMDDLLNSVLFMMMGLVLVTFPITSSIAIMGAISIVAVLLARYFSILGSAVLFIPLKPDFKKTPILMTWGGLRGGVSIALAMSIPVSNLEVKELFLTITFMVVFFSVFVQGLTLPRLLNYFNAKKIDEDVELSQEVPAPNIPSEEASK